MRFHDECGAESKTPHDVIVEYKKDIYKDRNAFCHVKCVAKKIGVMDEEHNLLVDNLVEQVAQANNLSKKESQTLVSRCLTEVDEFKDDACNLAIQGLKCLFRNGCGLIEQGDVWAYI